MKRRFAKTLKDILSDDEVQKTVECKSSVEFLFRNGKRLKIDSILSPEDFLRAYEKQQQASRFSCGNNVYFYVNKSAVDSFIINPLS